MVNESQKGIPDTWNLPGFEAGKPSVLLCWSDDEVAVGIPSFLETEMFTPAALTPLIYHRVTEFNLTRVPAELDPSRLWATAVFLGRTFSGGINFTRFMNFLKTKPIIFIYKVDCNSYCKKEFSSSMLQRQIGFMWMDWKDGLVHLPGFPSRHFQLTETA